MRRGGGRQRGVMTVTLTVKDNVESHSKNPPPQMYPRSRCYLGSDDKGASLPRWITCQRGCDGRSGRRRRGLFRSMPLEATYRGIVLIYISLRGEFIKLNGELLGLYASCKDADEQNEWLENGRRIIFVRLLIRKIYYRQMMMNI